MAKKRFFQKKNLLKFLMQKRLSKSPAVFDKQKLTWMNNQYVKQLELDRVVELSLPHLVKAGKVSETRTPEARGMGT